MPSHHYESLPVRQWVEADYPYVVTGTYKLHAADAQNTVVYINHSEGKAPCMVYAHIQSHAKGSGSGDTELASGTKTTFCFASVPLVNGVASTSQIAILIPDVATSDATVIRYTMLFFEGDDETQITQP